MGWAVSDGQNPELVAQLREDHRHWLKPTGRTADGPLQLEGGAGRLCEYGCGNDTDTVTLDPESFIPRRNVITEHNPETQGGAHPSCAQPTSKMA
jgi:hypothetical protein